MIRTGLHIIKEAALKYFSGGSVWVLLVFALGFLLLTRRKKRAAMYVALYGVFYGFVILNPVVSVIVTKLGLVEVYWRAFWFLPAGILISLSFTEIAGSLKKKAAKHAAVMALCAVLILSGGWMYTSDNYQRSTNIYKIPQSVLEVNELLEDGCRITGDDEIVIWIRTLNPTITTPYGRQAILNGGAAWQNRLRELWNRPVLPVKALTRRARKRHCDYIVVNKAKELKAPWEKYGLTLAGETDDYYIYAL